MSEKNTASEKRLEYIDYCRDVALGKTALSTKGKPIPEYKRLECQHVLNQLLARKKGAITLFSLVNGLNITDYFCNQGMTPQAITPLSEAAARRAFLEVVSSDIASGRLVIRDMVHFLRCNETPRVREVFADLDHQDWFEVSINVLVTLEDAVGWLQWHGRAVPDWLRGDQPIQINAWASHPEVRSKQRREQMLILERAVKEIAQDPLTIEEGGKGRIQSFCMKSAGRFTPDGFRACWKLALKLGFVRMAKHDLYARR